MCSHPLVDRVDQAGSVVHGCVINMRGRCQMSLSDVILRDTCDCLVFFGLTCLALCF